jgi:hypothetical protein
VSTAVERLAQALADVITEALSRDSAALAPIGATGDLTVAQLTVRFHRTASCVRGWLEKGLLAGYKLNGKDWRVSLASVEAFEAGQRATPLAPPVAQSNSVSRPLSAWRRGAAPKRRRR